MGHLYSTVNLISAPDQPGKKQMYHEIREAYCLNMYTVALKAITLYDESCSKILATKKRFVYPACT